MIAVVFQLRENCHPTTKDLRDHHLPRQAPNQIDQETSTTDGVLVFCQNPTVAAEYSNTSELPVYYAGSNGAFFGPRAGAEMCFYRSFILKTGYLPRQARDEHRNR
jgi:hypothetical protein